MDSYLGDFEEINPANSRRSLSGFDIRDPNSDSLT